MSDRTLIILAVCTHVSVIASESFSYTFSVQGEYKYFCIPHVPPGMRGTVTVEC